MPGAVAAGFAFAVLQVLGTTLVARFIAKASPIYGTFATVIGLITWMSMHAMALLLGAELNGVLPLSRLDLPTNPTDAGSPATAARRPQAVTTCSMRSSVLVMRVHGLRPHAAHGSLVDLLGDVPRLAHERATVVRAPARSARCGRRRTTA